MRSLLTLLFVCISSLMIAQEDIYSIQKEIDSTVWRPFKKAFEALNANDLNSLYAKDVLRVTPNGIDTKGLFKAKNIERFNTSTMEILLTVMANFILCYKNTKGTGRLHKIGIQP